MWGASAKRFVMNFNLESCLLKDHKPGKHAYKKNSGPQFKSS